MYILGPTFLTEKILTQEDGNRLILCVSKLPDISITVEGTVVQLIAPQLGYITTHFYQLKSKTWVDVTDSCGPVKRYCSTSILHMDFEFIDLRATGYWFIWFDHAPAEVAGAGKLLYEVVVERQDGGYPTNPLDGRTILRATPSNTYTEENPYRFYDKDLISHAVGHKCHYMIFSVYETGWYSYGKGFTIDLVN